MPYVTIQPDQAAAGVFQCGAACGCPPVLSYQETVGEFHRRPAYDPHHASGIYAGAV